MGANFANSFSVTPSLTMSNWNRLRYRSQRNFALDKPFTCLPNFAKICDAKVIGAWRSLVSAWASGAQGRRFKSGRPDHFFIAYPAVLPSIADRLERLLGAPRKSR